MKVTTLPAQHLPCCAAIELENPLIALTIIPTAPWVLLGAAAERSVCASILSGEEVALRKVCNAVIDTDI